MKILTDKKLNEIISKAKEEEWERQYIEDRFTQIYRDMDLIKSRVSQLEHEGKMPKLEQADCPWK